MEKDAVMNESPRPRPRLFAVKNCCRPFSMMIDSPKVTISVVSAAADRALDDRPMQDVADDRHQHDDDRDRPQHRHVGDRDDADPEVTRHDGEVAVRKVTTFMTPNISDSPLANSA